MSRRDAIARPEAAVQAFLSAQLPGSGLRGLVAGFSGGLDSRVLLHALARVAPSFGLSLRAVHLHHGLSPHADAWALQAQAACALEQVPLTVCHVQVARDVASLENAARLARQAAFARELRDGEALLLAQHRDDQAETLLFRLLRGAGLAGLGAMRPASVQLRAGGGPAPRWRPFLGLSRAELEAYARDRGLTWVEDESNADIGLDRNYLRHEILPRLAARWPAVTRTLADTAARLQEAEDLLQEHAQELADRCIDAAGGLGVAPLLALSPARQRLVLRFWLRQRGLPLPDAAVLEAVRVEVAGAAADAMPRVGWRGGEVRRHRGRLHALPPLAPAPAGWQCDWIPDLPLALPDGRCLRLAGEGAPPGPWRVRYREGGERLRATPRSPSRELRTWLQERSVPPWERERLPLVFAGDELIAVGDLPWPAPRSWRLELAPPARPGTPPE